MKRLVILGAGTGGTIMANKFRKTLSNTDWDVILIDKDNDHYYQPGLLFVPFGIQKRNDILKPKKKFIPSDVYFIQNNIELIDSEKNTIELAGGDKIQYDILVIATGTTISPEETTGLTGENWQKSIFDFYTIDGAENLAKALNNFKGGELLVNIVDMPIKCPIAPLEFAMMADAYFEKKGIRKNVSIKYVTPLSGAFTKPLASEMLGGLLRKKNIEVVPDFNLAEVNNDNKTLVDYAGQEVPFDLLVTIPLHSGDAVISKSGLGDDFGFFPTDKHTLKSTKHDNIFALGDATNIPTSKAGSVVHFQAEILFKNIMSYIEGKEMTASFDGHSNCFIETGFSKGTIIDFNYDTEPLPGTYPLPVLGPFSLLKETWFNHLGKLFFKWMYWHILLPDRPLPLPSHMSMVGKKKIK